MKLVKLAGNEIGIDRGNGLIERLSAQTPEEVVARIVDCFNACSGLGDPTMALFAAGGTKAGNLVERTIAWSLFFNRNNRAALELLEKARAELLKLKGKPV